MRYPVNVVPSSKPLPPIPTTTSNRKLLEDQQEAHNDLADIMAQMSYLIAKLTDRVCTLEHVVKKLVSEP